jgi:hypothetical protein
MFRRHIDFFAVFFIGAAMAGFSQSASFWGPDAMDSVRLQKVANIDSCPLAVSREVLSRIAYYLNQ